MNRRSFIKNSSIGGAGVVSTFHMPSFLQNKKIKIGLIGAGWYGMLITKSALKTGDVEVISICDVDSEHLNTGADEIEKLQGKRPETFKDYRDLLELKELEAVFIGTIPHWHALQFIAACEKGLDIYCEKPLAYDVEEGLAMQKAADKAGNIIQVGFQRRQANSYKKVKELIQDGTLGTVHQIDAQIHYNPNFRDNTVQPPPQSLDWEMWCGPAPKLDYRPNIGHFMWRFEKEYGNGHLVDWGIHHIDIIRKIMDFDMPESFISTGGMNAHKGMMTTPDTLTAQMYFKGCPVTWKHRLWGAGEVDNQFNNGIFFYGDKATLFANDRRLILMPAGKNKEQQVMDISTDGMQDKHVADFVSAVKAKDKSMISCTVADAFKSTSTVQLAMISFDTQSHIVWDAQQKTIIDNPEAKAMLSREYRKGYTKPLVS